MAKPSREPDDLFDAPEAPFELWVTLDYPGGSIELEWVRAETSIPEETMRVRLTNPDEITWEWAGAAQMPWKCRVHAQTFAAVSACCGACMRRAMQCSPA